MGAPAYFEIIFRKVIGFGLELNFQWEDCISVSITLPFVGLFFTYEKYNYQKPFCCSGWWGQ